MKKIVLLIMTILITPPLFAGVEITCGLEDESHIVFFDNGEENTPIVITAPDGEPISEAVFYKNDEGYDSGYFNGYVWNYITPYNYMTIVVSGMKNLKEGTWPAIGFKGNIVGRSIGGGDMPGGLVTEEKPIPCTVVIEL